MYTPSAFVANDLAHLDALVASDPFVTLVSSVDGLPFASHLPVLYARAGDRVLIEGHWAKANPQVGHGGKALMIVHGPHAYVSPGWYPDQEEAARVPTWNYAVAHLTGPLETSTDEDFLASVVNRLGIRHEAAVGGDWRYQHARDDHRSQLRGIVGFRFVPERVELKFKLSQNHPAANVHAVAAALSQQDDPDTKAIAAMMLERTPTS